MGRTARDDRDRRPHLQPVERIELNGEHVGRRLVFACIFLVIGIALLVYAFMQLIGSEEKEWITVEASSSVGASCGPEFTFLYHPGGGELSYKQEQNAVSDAYALLCREAYELFHSREAFEGVNNLYTINRHPNEILTVADGLYEALSAVERSGSRAIYLGPVYSRYNGLFSCTDDSQLADFDPRLSEDVAREYEEILRFANDQQAIHLELLGGGQIRLAVSEEYLAYAQREEIEDLIDFSWMRNAFIADFLAEGLIERGFTRGALSSYDGFIRNLDSSGTSYSLQIIDRMGQTIYPAAVMKYQGPLNIVSLWDYPLSDLDRYRFYQLADGEIRTPYLDPADGLCRNAVHTLTSYAGDKGCGEMLLEIAPVYIADAIQPEALERLAAGGSIPSTARTG